MAKVKKTPEQRFDKDMQEFCKYLNILLPIELDNSPVEFTLDITFCDESFFWHYEDVHGLVLTSSMSAGRLRSVLSLLHRFFLHLRKDRKYYGAKFQTRYEIYDCDNRLKIIEVGV